MIVEYIVDIIEQELLVRHNNDEPPPPPALSYMTRYLFSFFDIESMFAMQLSSNQTVPNLGRVASILMILVTTLQWTKMNLPHASCMSVTSYLFMITLTVDWISSSSHHGLNAFPDPWVLFPLFRNEFLSVPLRMRLLIPMMST